MLVPYSIEGNATLFQYVFPINTLLQLFAIIEYVRFASLICFIHHFFFVGFEHVPLII